MTMCDAQKNLNSQIWETIPLNSMANKEIEWSDITKIEDTSSRVFDIIQNKISGTEIKWNEKKPDLQKLINSMSKKQLWDNSILSHAKKALKNMDKTIWGEVLMKLNSCKDIKILTDIHTEIVSRSLDEAQKKYYKLTQTEWNDPKKVDEAILGSEIIWNVTILNAHINNCRNEVEVVREFTIKKWFLANILSIFKTEEKKSAEKINFEIWWAIKEMQSFIEKRWDLDKIVEGLNGVEEKFRIQHEEDYKIYVTLNYMAVVIGNEIKKITREIKRWNLDEIEEVKKKERINELNAISESIINQAEYMKQYSILEFLNSKYAKNTSNRVSVDYNMMVFLLWRKIENYFNSAELIKWVNLGLALKDWNTNLMKKSLEESKQLLESQMEIQQGGVEFLKDLSSEMKKHQAELEKINKKWNEDRKEIVQLLENLWKTWDKILDMSNNTMELLEYEWGEKKDKLEDKNERWDEDNELEIKS